MMRISFSACKQQPQPHLLNFPLGINMDPFIERRRKDKVVVVMGATGTGKSRLSIDLATCFNAEIINSDKIQVYQGLDIVTNKVTEDECKGVPHHLLGVIDPDADFTALDFRRHALASVDSIVRRGRLPIIAGGSNSYIKALVNDDVEFRSNYECCFLWVDVSLPVLQSVVSERVVQMTNNGLVDEVRAIFDPKTDYTRGIRRAIGVPEMDEYLKADLSNANDETKAMLLKEAIEKIKYNTCELALRQLRNISRLEKQLEWYMHRIDATEVFLTRGDKLVDKAWERLVAGPSTMIVERFLYAGDYVNALGSPNSISAVIGNCPAAVVAATR